VTLLVGVAACLLAVALSQFTADLAQASTLRARAQLAADAAALAAVAEAGPYGAGDHETTAARFAAANGARVIECLCEPGATAVEVKVAVDDVVASARAIFDPTKLIPTGPIARTAELHPLLRSAVDRLLAEANGAVLLVSGFRSAERQTSLWNEALARYGDPEVADDWVARPGSSMHERGLAVDLGGDLTLARRLIETLGLPLYQPMAHEPHHFELRL
jgi:zinc D-Ala-D-Ala carboxypeptidase